MQDNTNAKRALLKPAPPTSSPNTSKYISPKTTKILNSNTSNHASSRYLNARGSTNASSNSLSSKSLTSSTSSLDKPKIAKEDSVECLFEVQGVNIIIFNFRNN